MSKEEKFKIHRVKSKVKLKKLGEVTQHQSKQIIFICTVVTKQRLHLSTIWTKPIVHCHLLENLKLP